MKSNRRTFAASDPIFLEELDAIRPVKGIEFIDESLGVFGDAQHPLAQRSAFDGVAFGTPFLNFFVGKHGAQIRRPIDGGFRDIGEADIVDLIAGPAFGAEFGDRFGATCRVVEIRIVELQEDPLRPAHILRIGGGDFTLPIVGKPECLELAAEIFDVGGGGDRRVLAGFDGILFGGQAEGIVAHWMQDVEAAHAFVTADDIRGGISFRVADVEAATARIGKHVEHVVFRFGGIKARITGAGSAEGLVRFPTGLPCGFEFAEGERFAVVRHV